MNAEEAKRRNIKRIMPLMEGDIVTYPYLRGETVPEGYEQIAYCICDGEGFFATRYNTIVITSEEPPSREVLRTGQVIAQVWRKPAMNQAELDIRELVAA